MHFEDQFRPGDNNSIFQEIILEKKPKKSKKQSKSLYESNLLDYINSEEFKR